MSQIARIAVRGTIAEQCSTNKAADERAGDANQYRDYAPTRIPTRHDRFCD
jgi:hypothetical protein